LFAAKEALFKCHFPAGRRRFWFLDAELARSGGVAGSRQVALRVLVDTGPSTPAGTVTEGYVMAAPVDDAVVAVVSMTSRQG
jgi:4'-phosphopantetheinyl transferase EntD